MTEELKSVRKTFNLYATTLGILILAVVIGRFNARFGLVQEKMKIFDLVVYPEYVSAIIGILFGLFVVILYLQIRLLKIGLQKYVHAEHKECHHVATTVLYFPWVASPFHASKVGWVLFWCGIGSGCLVVLWVVVAHVLELIETSSPKVFQAIGYFDFVILAMALFVLWSVKNNVREIRQMVAEMSEGSV